MGVTGEEKAHGLNPGPLAERVSTLTTELSVQTVGLRQFPPAEKDSSSNLLGTMPETSELVSLLLAARAQAHTEPSNVTGGGHMGGLGLEPRTPHRPCEYSDH